MEELHFPKRRSILLRRTFQRATDQRPNEDPQIIRKREETKRPSLRMLGADFTQHCAHRYHRAREHTSQAPEKNHLPQRLAHAEQCRGDSHTQ